MPPAQPVADSEPVAWTWHYREQWHVTNDERRAEFVAKDGDVAVLPLYRHAQPAPVVQEVDADDNFYSWFGREWRENYQHNQYTTAAKQMLGVMAESAWKAGRRAAMLQSGNSPVVPDERAAFNAWNNDVDCPLAGRDAKSAAWLAWQSRAAMLAAAPHDTPALNSVQSVVTGSDTWIQVSERMPEKGQAVLVYRPKAHEGGDSDVRVAVYGRHNFEHGFGCYWEPSHWMPLPAAPQEVGDA
ncbi:TPA: DUF551 domain-containing protein [Klebsiella pneumoniae]